MPLPLGKLIFARRFFATSSFRVSTQSTWVSTVWMVWPMWVQCVDCLLFIWCDDFKPFQRWEWRLDPPTTLFTHAYGTHMSRPLDGSSPEKYHIIHFTTIWLCIAKGKKFFAFPNFPLCIWIFQFGEILAKNTFDATSHIRQFTVEANEQYVCVVTR